MPRVKATRECFYGGSRRRVGSVFDISDKKDDDGNLVEFAPKSMKIVDEDTPVQKRPPLLGNQARTIKASDVNPSGGPVTHDSSKKQEGNTDEVTLASAVSRLDHTDDAHWTKDGKPDLNVLKEMMGKAVKRGEVDEAFPELKRREQS